MSAIKQIMVIQCRYVPYDSWAVPARVHAHCLRIKFSTRKAHMVLLQYEIHNVVCKATSKNMRTFVFVAYGPISGDSILGENERYSISFLLAEEEEKKH